MRGENGYPRIRKSSKTMSAYEAAAVTNDAPSGQKPSFWGRTSLRAGQHRQCPDLGNRSCWLRPLTRLQVSSLGNRTSGELTIRPFREMRVGRPRPLKEGVLVGIDADHVAHLGIRRAD